ncbi:hypothetical protein [Herpetosiphon geysericola]|uniref:hypothetical protein n=1 Tax=Herpetosiphon geysericola TaxID=70996 RepID=UPI0006C91B4F|nr:hypothetical protein [Herpetosiphon geysericola]
MAIVVKTKIHASFAALWQATQQPNLHQRWDLRFSTIEYCQRADDAQPQAFLYTTHIGFGLQITGRGETSTKQLADGRMISALRFWSEHPLSLIRSGAGYWLYTPTSDGIDFSTSYDYQTRFGRLGWLIDRLLFRPLMAWATAWSFDRLRLWVEQQLDPALALRTWLKQRIAVLAILGMLFICFTLVAWQLGLVSAGLLLVGMLRYRKVRSAQIPSAQHCFWSYKER